MPFLVLWPKQNEQNSSSTCQNKMIRFILGLSPRTHLDNREFRKVGWLPVEKRVWQMGLHHICNILNGHGPPYLSTGIQRISDVHSSNTRSSAFGLVVPRVYSHGQETLMYNSIKLWNGLPLAIQSLPTVGRFKVALKRHFLF